MVGRMTLQGEKIVVTGATGQVGFPVTVALASGNEVMAPARFSDPKAKERLEAAGVRCMTADLAAGDFDEVPTDVDYVLNFAVVKTNRWDVDLAANAEGAGLLMARTKGAKAFLHCSSTGVYQDTGGGPYAETDPLGDNHRVIMPTYSISKIAAEAVVRTWARRLGPADDDRPPQRALRRQRRLARVPPRDDARPASRCRSTPTGPTVQPDPRGRHHRDGPGAARRSRASRPRS